MIILCLFNFKIFLKGLPISGAINFGLTVMIIIQIFGHISFAIINPAIAIAAVIHKMISVKVKKKFLHVKSRNDIAFTNF